MSHTTTGEALAFILLCLSAISAGSTPTNPSQSQATVPSIQQHSPIQVKSTDIAQAVTYTHCKTSQPGTCRLFTTTYTILFPATAEIFVWDYACKILANHEGAFPSTGPLSLDVGGLEIQIQPGGAAVSITLGNGQFVGSGKGDCKKVSEGDRYTKGCSVSFPCS
jgi:hypothetical protein